MKPEFGLRDSGFEGWDNRSALPSGYDSAQPYSSIVSWCRTNQSQFLAYVLAVIPAKRSASRNPAGMVVTTVLTL